MALSRSGLSGSHDSYWYEEQRHANQRRNAILFNTPGWFYCDPDSFYRSLFPEGFLQERDGSGDGRPNMIVVEDTGQERSYAGRDGAMRTKRVMHRYTVHDDLDKLEELRDLSIERNTFMFTSPISYYGKSRSHTNARYLHAFMIDLDYVGDLELKNLLHQMERGAIPPARFIVSSGTGLHVVYPLEKPIPLMKRYIDGLQAIKYALTERVWNENTSASDPEKKQHQGIFQGFRMVGTSTKLNGDIGKPKLKQPYLVEAFSHDSTPPTTISELLRYLPELRGFAGMDDLEAAEELTKASRSRTPIAQAREMWPEWYENTVERKMPRSGWLFGRAGYDDCLATITEQASVSHRYWCVFYLAVMANKCGVTYEELEEDAYGLLERFDDLSVDPSNRFTERDVATALEAYEGGSASGRARRYTKDFCERHSAVSWEKRGTKQNPPEKRLPPAETLEKARAIRDLNQRVKGTHWWDNGNRAGAPTKAMQVWQVAYSDPKLSHSEIARRAGVSRPTVIKWLGVEDWEDRYARELEATRREQRREVHSAMLDVAKRQEADSQHEPDEHIDEHDLSVLKTLLENPWKTYEEIAVVCGLPSGSDVRRIVHENREEYGRMLIGKHPYPHEVELEYLESADRAPDDSAKTRAPRSSRL